MRNTIVIDSNPPAKRPHFWRSLNKGFVLAVLGAVMLCMALCGFFARRRNRA